MSTPHASTATSAGSICAREFRRNDDGRRSYVHRQPVGPEEEAACMAALEECPVEAIGRGE